MLWSSNFYLAILFWKEFTNLAAARNKFRKSNIIVDIYFLPWKWHLPNRTIFLYPTNVYAHYFYLRRYRPILWKDIETSSTSGVNARDGPREIGHLNIFFPPNLGIESRGSVKILLKKIFNWKFYKSNTQDKNRIFINKRKQRFMSLENFSNSFYYI